MKLNEIAIKDNIGCLFILGDPPKKYIYVGLQPNNQRDKEEVPTFYSLDDIETGTPGTDLTGKEIVDFFNMSKKSPGDALLQIVESDVFSQYKKGIPPKLRILPVYRSGPAAFYKISGNNGTPIRFTTYNELKEQKEQKLKEPSATYVSRIGSVGPSVSNIANGRIADIQNFIKDYTAMTIKKNIGYVPGPGDEEGFVFPDKEEGGPDQEPIEGRVFPDEEPVEGIVFPDQGPDTTTGDKKQDEEPVEGSDQGPDTTTGDKKQGEEPVSVVKKTAAGEGGKKTKRRRKNKKSKTYKNKPYIA